MMQIKKALAKISLVTVLIMVWFATDAIGDMIKFKRGARKQCVVLEETDKSVRFLTAMGEIVMPLSRIESIERESDEVNETLKKEWAERKTKAPKEPESVAEPVEEKPSVRRTYNIEITKRRVSLGGKAEVGNAQLVVSFVIDDFGMVEGSRLFRIGVTSYKTAPADISPANFYVLLHNGTRVDPKPLEGYEMLDNRVHSNETVTGHMAFPADGNIEKLILKSDLADFELDLESGEFASPRSGLF